MYNVKVLKPQQKESKIRTIYQKNGPKPLIENKTAHHDNTTLAFASTVWVSQYRQFLYRSKWQKHISQFIFFHCL